MPRTLLLFDIDGTILLTGGAGMRAMAHAVRELFGREFTWEGIIPAGSLDPVIFAEALALNGLDDHPDHHESFQSRYLERLAHEIEQVREHVKVMPGIIDLLVALHQREQQRGDLVLGMLTGNYSAAAPIKLRAVGVEPDWFTLTAFGEEGRTRPDLVALAMQKYEQRFGEPIDPARVIVIGDTHRDVHCAKAHGCVAFAVLTSGRTREELIEAGADVVVEDLSDPGPLMALIDRMD
jgi:phosphoglycolate phosphatase-like HAD superfamily hydrolase